MSQHAIPSSHLEYLYRSNVAQQLDTVSEEFHRRLKDKLVAQGYQGLRLSFSTVLANMQLSGTRLVDIAGTAGMSKQAVGQIANEIEKLGYIQRVPDPNDGRAKNLIFTELGQQLIQDSIVAVGEVELEFSTLVGDQKIQQLESLLTEISQKLMLRA